MNEFQARNAILLRAYETASGQDARAPWSDEDRDWATRAAQEVEGERAPAEAFIARRAALGAERLRKRDDALDRALRALRWRPWLGWALALAALAAGFAADAIGATGRVNLLAPPLFALIAWNLAVYLLLAMRAARGFAQGERARAGLLAQLVARAARAAAPAERLARRSPVVSVFVAQWLEASAPLAAARVARILHVAAAAFAAGAVGGMYLRGLGLAYLAGWESTFLGPQAVHAILSVLLAPASALTAIDLPDAAHLAAIRFDVSPGEGAARWIHLYATTLALAVVAPRLLLAAASAWRERGLARRFPIALDAPYFVALAGAHRGQAASVRIVPYSYRLAPQAALGLEAILARVFGKGSHASIAPAVEFGAEGALDPSLLAGGPHAFAAALFGATATPEKETHGAFVAALSRLAPANTPFLVLVDESPFHERFGRDPQAGARRDERRAAWAKMLAALECAPVFVDPCAPDPAPSARALEAAIARGPAPPAAPEAAAAAAAPATPAHAAPPAPRSDA